MSKAIVKGGKKETILERVKLTPIKTVTYLGVVVGERGPFGADVVMATSYAKANTLA